MSVIFVKIYFPLSIFFNIMKIFKKNIISIGTNTLVGMRFAKRDAQKIAIFQLLSTRNYCSPIFYCLCRLMHCRLQAFACILYLHTYKYNTKLIGNQKL